MYIPHTRVVFSYVRMYIRTYILTLYLTFLQERDCFPLNQYFTMYKHGYIHTYARTYNELLQYQESEISS